MAKALVGKPNAASQSGKFTSSAESEKEGVAMFANVVQVSFSAFDHFELIPEKKKIRLKASLTRTSGSGAWNRKMVA
jgi:hypothetical protein